MLRLLGLSARLLEAAVDLLLPRHQALAPIAPHILKI
jgi:hypothetical protein